MLPDVEDPTSNAFHSELGSISTCSQIDKWHIIIQSENSIWRNLAKFLNRKIVIKGWSRITFFAILLSIVREVAKVFLLLAINWDYWIASFKPLLALGIDEVKLVVAVRVRWPYLQQLTICLLTVAKITEDAPYNVGTNIIAFVFKHWAYFSQA